MAGPAGNGHKFIEMTVEMNVVPIVTSNGKTNIAYQIWGRDLDHLILSCPEVNPTNKSRQPDNRAH